VVIYASDPEAASDSEFEPGELRHLVVGNRGRLLDARRTPITVVAVVPERGAFALEIGAFEDAGARWELPLQDVGRFQFARDAKLTAAETLLELERARARFDRELAIDCDPSAHARTLELIARERESMRAALERERVVLDRHVAAREGHPALFELLGREMAARGVAELDEVFASTFVSNPGSGELVKGHAIVLAELGLCRYRGKVVRDPDLFAGSHSKADRTRHLIARIAFSQELFATLGHRSVTLYRGAAVEGQLPVPAPASFLSATFSSEVASEHFEGSPSTTTAVLWRQRVPTSRLLMTFLETKAMNLRYKEAEAVLIADPENRAF
jgi:hypothetical protein